MVRSCPGAGWGEGGCGGAGEKGREGNWSPRIALPGPAFLCWEATAAAKTLLRVCE